MKIFESLADVSLQKKPYGLAIGNFDGVHLGHRQIIQELRSLVTDKGSVVALTFKNHPSEFFTPDSPVCYLSSYEQKIALMKEAGVDALIMLNFDEEIASKPFDVFLDDIRKSLPFSFLVRGKGSVLGKNRTGSEDAIHTYAKNHKFKALYIPIVQIEDTAVNSSQIRECVKQADLKKAHLFLGRPYGIRVNSQKIGHISPYTLVDFSLDKSCLPPKGEYLAELVQDHLHVKGVLKYGKNLQFIFKSHDSFDRNHPFLLNLIQAL